MDSVDCQMSCPVCGRWMVRYSGGHPRSYCGVRCRRRAEGMRVRAARARARAAAEEDQVFAAYRLKFGDREVARA